MPQDAVYGLHLFFITMLMTDEGQNQSAGIFDLFSGRLMKKSAVLFLGTLPQICLGLPQFGIEPTWGC